MALEIRRLQGVDTTRWDDFVERCDDATFFHLSGWAHILETVGHETHFLLAEQDSEIRGVLPLAHIRSLLFGNSLISTPFCVYGGVASEDEEARRALLDAAQELAAQLKVDYLEIRGLVTQARDWPSKDLYVTFRKDIDPDPDKNLAAIPRKQRAMVRKGVSAGLRGRIDSDLRDFFSIYATSVRNLGTPVFSRAYFEALSETFGQRCSVLTVEHQGRPISSVLSFYFRDQVLPYYGGGLPEARQLKAYDFMYWDLMRRSAETGLRVFDYGRSKVGSGSYSFKKNWGFTPQPLHYQYHLVKSQSIPNVSPANPKYHVLVEAWKRLPLPVANFLGPFLSRNLG
jgi:FemAB-related protein (PEP-CTERM system-associated)